ncbi:MAG: c-type cytochrome domain-containing protein [Isosphaeraceae bacterium]
MATNRTWGMGIAVLAALTMAPSAMAGAEEKPAADAPQVKPVSFDTQVRPIFQAHCQGCHQPAKAGGGYVMTAFDRLLSGGESEVAAVVPKDLDASFLIEQITPEDGKAAMPKDKPPLSLPEIETIRLWIAQGAVDDTPLAAKARYDQEHPPVYTRPTVITALDYSPDGQLLAVGGFHEILLWKADGS